jgi:hypothetical protein
VAGERFHSAAKRRGQLEERQLELASVAALLTGGGSVGEADAALARLRATEAAEQAQRARENASLARQRAAEAHRLASAMWATRAVGDRADEHTRAAEADEIASPG